MMHWVIIMLNKYTNITKLSQRQQCALYSATHTQQNTPVLLKRIMKPEITWHQVLKNSNPLFRNKSAIFTPMIEVFKHKGSFYVVHEAPQGPCLTDTQQVGRVKPKIFYQMFEGLCRQVIELQDKVPNAYVYPEWIFMHKDGTRIIHFQPFFSQLVSPRRQPSVVFELGRLAYYLLTGNHRVPLPPQEESSQRLSQIQTDAAPSILEATGDKRLAKIVSSMLGDHPPRLQKVIERLTEEEAEKRSPTQKRFLSPIRAGLGILDITTRPLKTKKKHKLFDLHNPQLRERRECCREKRRSLERIQQEETTRRLKRAYQHKIDLSFRQGQPQTRLQGLLTALNQAKTPNRPIRYKTTMEETVKPTKRRDKLARLSLE